MHLEERTRCPLGRIRTDVSLFPERSATELLLRYVEKRVAASIFGGSGRRIRTVKLRIMSPVQVPIPATPQSVNLPSVVKEPVAYYSTCVDAPQPQNGGFCRIRTCGLLHVEETLKPD